MQVADQIDAHADRVLGTHVRVPRTERMSVKAELRATVSDMQLMSLMGKYYAAKIRGATELAMFRETRDPAHQKRAVEQLALARQHWSQYTERASAQYRNPLWTNRVGFVDWQELSGEVANDVALAAAPLTAR